MINRDGVQASLWQGTSQPYRSTSNTPVKDVYDVIIVGGGITGVTTANTLQQTGLSCLLLEANTLCYGTTGGTTAHINTLLDVPYTQLIKNFDRESAASVCSATRNAIHTMRSNIDNLHIDCGWKETSAYLIAETPEQAAELDDIAAACRQVGLQPKATKDIPVPIPAVSALIVGEQARLHPVRYVHALASQFENGGGKLIQNCRVTKMTESDAHVELDTLQGPFRGKWIVFATHIPPTINVLHLRCAPYRSYAMALKISERQHFEGLVYDMQDPYHYYRMQEIDGDSFLIAGGKDHKTGHQKDTVTCIRTLESHVRKHFQVESVVNSWSSQYYESADGLPYIGHLPGHSARVLVATGFGGNGMTYSSIASDVIKNIVSGKEHFLIELFSPSRIKPIAGFKNVASHNLAVTKEIVTSLFKSSSIDGFADLAPGEGKVVGTDDGKIAVNKDEQGGIHAVNATCTHMGCKVTWNQFEKSWDCPCHGARFDVDGVVLNGPAVNDLEYLNVEVIGSLTDQ